MEKVYAVDFLVALFDLIVSDCQSSVAMSDASPVLKKATKGGGTEGKVIELESRTVKAVEAAGSEDLRAELKVARARAAAAESRVRVLQEVAAVKSPRRKSPSRSCSSTKRSWDGRDKRSASRDRRSRSRYRRSRSRDRRSRSRDRRSRSRDSRTRSRDKR